MFKLNFFLNEGGNAEVEIFITAPGRKAGQWDGICPCTEACWQHSPVAWSLSRPLLQKLPETGDGICSGPLSREQAGLRTTQWTSVISSLSESESRCLEQATVNSDTAGRWIRFRTEDHSRRQKYLLNSEGLLATWLPSLKDLGILVINSKSIQDPFGTSNSSWRPTWTSEKKPQPAFELLIQSMCWTYKCNATVWEEIAQAC